MAWRCYMCGERGRRGDLQEHYDEKHPVKPKRTTPEPIPDGQLHLFGEDTA